jgi:hypothetical protein
MEISMLLLQVGSTVRDSLRTGAEGRAQQEARKRSRKRHEESSSEGFSGQEFEIIY